MKNYNVTLDTMSAHSASRPACAPIQGKIINIVPESDPNYDHDYDSLYNHDYGKASGTQGVNCHHRLFPYVKGVSTNTFEHPDEKKAIENGQIQQKQRALERNIRLDKRIIEYADKAHDVYVKNHYQNYLAAHRKKIRDLVEDHSFLHRDYSREKIYTYKDIDYNKTKQRDSKQYINSKIKDGTWLKKINQEKQMRHNADNHSQDKSYLKSGVDPNELLHQYSGKGILEMDRNGNFSNKEKCTADKVIGYAVSSKNGKFLKEVPTKQFKIHYSKTGSHIVPTNFR